jgi:ABC-type transport system involved in multi-copper enzyme maturation permease subunit
MNGFDQLVWREWRRSRTILFAALGIIVALLLLVFSQPQTPPEAAGGEIRVVGSMAVVGYFASWIAVHVSVFLLPMIAANSLAGERADRSAEFIAPLPVSRAVRLMAKVVLLAAVAIALWAPMLVVASLLRGSQLVKADDYLSGLELLGRIATFAILTTALAWLLAGWIESPVIAAVMAIAIPVAVPWAMFSLQAPFLAPASFFGLWIDSEGIPQPLTFLVAAAFFTAGSALYLRRLE